MILDLDSSYPAMVKHYGGDSVMSPEALRRDSVLGGSVAILDQLCEHVFSPRFDDMTVHWGVRESEQIGAWVESGKGKGFVLVDSGALLRIRACRDDPAFRSWLERELCPQLLSSPDQRLLAEGIVPATVQMLGLAMLFGHELGHILDGSCDDSAATRSQNAWLAEEISADGHAMQMGLRLARVWAADLAEQGLGAETELFHLATVLLLIAHSMLGEIEPAAPWKGEPRDSHPPPSQRFIGTCVVVAEHTRAEDAEFRGEAFLFAGQGLAVLGVLPQLTSNAALEAMLDAYDEKLVKQQYGALRRVLAKRR